MATRAQPKPLPFSAWLDGLVKEVPDACPNAKVEVGDTVEIEGREGRKIYVDTSLPGICINCTVIAGEFPGEMPVIRIDGSSSTIELWGSDPRLYAIQLLNDLVRFHFFSKLKAREHSDFLVTKEFAQVESHEDDDDVYDGAHGFDSYPRFNTDFVVKTPSNCYRIGLALLPLWGMDRSNFSIWTGGHFIVRSDLNSKQLDEQEIIDVIAKWDSEHGIPMLPRLQAYLEERKFVVRVDDDGLSPPRLNIDLGDRWVASLELGAKGIICIFQPDWKMRLEICDSAFIKHAELMQAVAGLTFEKLRNWSVKTKLNEPEVTQGVIVEGDFY